MKKVSVVLASAVLAAGMLYSPAPATAVEAMYGPTGLYVNKVDAL